MLDKQLLEILVCPKCKGDLEYVSKDPSPDSQKLRCHACRLEYAIQEDIPIMLIDEAKPF